MNYTIKTNYNGNKKEAFVNFDNGTYAKVVSYEKQGLKQKYHNLIGIYGNYDKDSVVVRLGTLGEVEVIEKSKEKAGKGEVLNHKAFGEVTVMEKQDGKIRVKLASGEEKVVLESFFMNGVK